MPSTKYMELSNPTHFLKSRGSDVKILFLNTKLNTSSFFALQKVFHTLFATNIAKHIPYRHISCSYSDTIYRKSIKINHKNFPSLKFNHFFYIRQHFLHVKV